MLKEEKITKIKRLANVEGCIFLNNGINIRGEHCNIVSNVGVMVDIDGDWCLVAKFENMSEEEIQIVFSAVVNHAREILSMA